jgi:hypothetical protein
MVTVILLKAATMTMQVFCDLYSGKSITWMRFE